MSRESIAGRVDYHIHFSEESVESVIKEAKDAGIVAMALIARLEMPDDFSRLRETGNSHGIDTLLGVEFLGEVNGDYVDILTIGFDPANDGIQEIFSRTAKIERDIQIAEIQKTFLEEQGFTFDDLTSKQDIELLEQVLRGEIPEKAINYCRLVAGSHANNQKIEGLKQKHPLNWEDISTSLSHLPSYQDKQTALEAKFLYDLYFSPGKKGHLRYKHLTSQGLLGKIIDVTHDAGGVVLYSPEGAFKEKAWEELIEMGIDGIMGWHGGRLELEKDVIKNIRSKGLLVLGGSDHDPSKDHWQIGSGNGVMQMSPRRHEELKEYLNSHR